EFYEMARTRFGVNFVRGRVGEVTEDAATGNLFVRVENTETGAVEDVKHDLLVLSPGVQPPADLSEMVGGMGIQVDTDGYVEVEDGLLNPVDTKVPGVYVCGCAEGPRDIPDSVAAGSAAAMRAAITLVKGDDKK
ncbi:MAG: FAD-dependent oxidoreductase, partial [Candidatus Thorarchaeota archaeon]